MKFWTLVGNNILCYSYFECVLRTIIPSSDDLEYRLKIPILVRKFVAEYSFEESVWTKAIYINGS